MGVLNCNFGGYWVNGYLKCFEIENIFCSIVIWLSKEKVTAEQWNSEI